MYVRCLKSYSIQNYLFTFGLSPYNFSLLLVKIHHPSYTPHSVSPGSRVHWPQLASTVDTLLSAVPHASF